MSSLSSDSSEVSPIKIIINDSCSANMLSIMKSMFQNLFSSPITCLIKFFHISPFTLFTPSSNKRRILGGGLYVVLFILTRFFTTDHAISIGFNSQWNGGRCKTFLLYCLTYTSITYVDIMQMFDSANDCHELSQRVCR